MHKRVKSRLIYQIRKNRRRNKQAYRQAVKRLSCKDCR